MDAGLDITVSVPKSVSVFCGLGPPEVAAAVVAAHRVAIVEALGYLEIAARHALRGHHGDGHRADRIGTQGWIVAAFEQRASRASDPQLHTRLVVPNLLRGRRTNHLYSPADNPAVGVDNDVYLAQLVADLGTSRAHIMANVPTPTTGDSDRSSTRPKPARSEEFRYDRADLAHPASPMLVRERDIRSRTPPGAWSGLGKPGQRRVRA